MGRVLLKPLSINYLIVDEAEELFGPHVPTANRRVFAESYVRVYSANLFPSNTLNIES